MATPSQNCHTNSKADEDIEDRSGEGGCNCHSAKAFPCDRHICHQVLTGISPRKERQTHDCGRNAQHDAKEAQQRHELVGNHVQPRRRGCKADEGDENRDRQSHRHLSTRCIPEDQKCANQRHQYDEDDTCGGTSHQIDAKLLVGVVPHPQGGDGNRQGHQRPAVVSIAWHRDRYHPQHGEGHFAREEHLLDGAVLVAAVRLPPQLCPVLEELLTAGLEGIDPTLGRAAGLPDEAGLTFVVLDLGRFDGDGTGGAASWLVMVMMPVGVMVKARGVLEVDKTAMMGMEDHEGLDAVGIAGSPALIGRVAVLDDAFGI
mmetsp:Transcript_23366/g.67343  ORF Transcript_23366/g.67343 Transcript_23366/m.67343 type:complete len:316 (-) Transcript_23366:146-1093(-)